jgi:hypothetical protein
LPYTPTNWENREVERPRTYTFQNNGDGTTTLIPAEGNIISEGTPIVAENLNNMEEGIDNALDATIGGTVSGDVTIFGNLSTGANNTIYTNKLQSGSQPLKIQSSSNDILFMHSSGNWLKINNNMLQNPTGDGNMILSAGDGAGLLILKSPTNTIRMMSNEVRVANVNYDGYVPIFASEFTNVSKRELKKNIVPFEANAETIINGAMVRQFQFKTESDTDLPHIGLIVDEAPLEAINPKGDGIDLYAMISIAWKSIQELSAKVTDLENQIQANPTP